MPENWYSNKDLFEMFQDLRSDVAELRTELAATREAIRRYNGLQEDIADLQQRLTAVEAQGAGGDRTLQRAVQVGSFLIALSSLFVAGVALFLRLKGA